MPKLQTYYHKEGSHQSINGVEYDIPSDSSESDNENDESIGIELLSPLASTKLPKLKSNSDKLKYLLDNYKNNSKRLLITDPVKQDGSRFNLAPVDLFRLNRNLANCDFSATSLSKENLLQLQKLYNNEKVPLTRDGKIDLGSAYIETGYDELQYIGLNRSIFDFSKTSVRKNNWSRGDYLTYAQAQTNERKHQEQYYNSNSRGSYPTPAFCPKLPPVDVEEDKTEEDKSNSNKRKYNKI